MGKEPFILPILRLLIQKANEEKVSDVAKNIKNSMEGQTLIEFSITDERSVYIAMPAFKRDFNISYTTLSGDLQSIILAFPGSGITKKHIDFWEKRDVSPNQL